MNDCTIPGERRRGALGRYRRAGRVASTTLHRGLTSKRTATVKTRAMRRDRANIVLFGSRKSGAIVSVSSNSISFGALLVGR
jgi:hypothetical protein